MCSCGLQDRKTFVQIIKQDGSSLPMLKYIHCKYSNQFESLFANIGIIVDESKLKLLATAHDTGADKQGVIKDKFGKPIYFSVENIIKQINPNMPVNNSCSL